MHLKNFSLIENSRGEFELSPAYDLVNTAIVMPEDKEEAALTMNGKKSRLKRLDFDVFAFSLQINEKSLASIYNRFESILPEWISFVERSFLSGEMKEEYVALLQKRHKKLFS
jgi:serine/threonine-protein kinase HipA